MKLLDNIYKLAGLVKKIRQLNTEHIEPLPSLGIIEQGPKTSGHSDGFRIETDPDIDELFRDMAFTIEKLVDDCIRLKAKKSYREKQVGLHLVEKAGMR